MPWSSSARVSQLYSSFKSQGFNSCWNLCVTHGWYKWIQVSWGTKIQISFIQYFDDAIWSLRASLSETKEYTWVKLLTHAWCVCILFTRPPKLRTCPSWKISPGGKKMLELPTPIWLFYFQNKILNRGNTYQTFWVRVKKAKARLLIWKKLNNTLLCCFLIVS